jgi:thymidylate kinase
MRSGTDGQNVKGFESTEKVGLVEEEAGGSGPQSNGDMAFSTLLLNRLFAKLDALQFHYCILRNFERLPDQIDGDIDILVRQADLPKVEAILLSIMDGFLLIRRIVRNRHLQFYIVSEDEVALATQKNCPFQKIQLDFVTENQWHGIPYLDTEEVLSAKERYGNFYVATLEHRAVHLLCHAILDKNSLKSEYEEVILEAVAKQDKAWLESLCPFVGVSLVQRLYSALSMGDASRLLELRSVLMARLLFRTHRSVLAYMSFQLEKYARIGKAVLFPPGILIATAGPDGAGKSTLLGRVRTVFSGGYEFVEDQYMGWKEFILPTKRLLALVQKAMSSEKDAPHLDNEDSAPEANLPWTHNFSILHYFLDLWARYLFRIRPVLARGGLVLCDRYFYDMFLQEAWVCRNVLSRSLLLSLTPKPTVTVTLAGDPEAIAARKRENSSAETARQLVALAMLKESRDDIVELSAFDAPGDNVLSVFHHLFKQETSA